MVVQTFYVDNGPLIQCQIAFFITARMGKGVVQISEMEIKAPKQTVAQKYAIIACVTRLANIGYTLPTLSSVLIQAINADMRHDVEGFCASIAQNNRSDVVKSNSNLSLISGFVVICCKAWFFRFFCQHLQVEDYDLTYKGCNFEAILNQTMYQLGYDWKYAHE